MNQQARSPASTIGCAIVITLAFVVVFLGVVLNNAPGLSVGTKVIGVAGYALIHPIMGRLCSALALGMANAVDRIYGLNGKDRWGGWGYDFKVMFAAAWPLVAPLHFAIALLAIIYGLLFKRLF